MLGIPSMIRFIKYIPLLQMVPSAFLPFQLVVKAVTEIVFTGCFITTLPATSTTESCTWWFC